MHVLGRLDLPREAREKRGAMGKPRIEETERASRPPGSSAAATVGLRAVVLNGSARGRAPLVGKKLTIGKAPENDLVLDDPLVSRTHCEIERVKDGLLVRDLGSTNGTRLDGVRVHEAIARPGSVVGVGSVDVSLRPTALPIDALPSKNDKFGEAWADSLAMRSIFGVLEFIAPSDATVLLTGETGTGKDVLARSIVQRSRRKDGPFVVVDCGAMKWSLAESELFGHERGAFTGADAARKGAFELADGGTIFLDEIGELPLDVQPKLLRVIETRKFQRVGSSKVQTTDVRVIAATKRDLEAEVAAGRFREDLFFRLAVVPVHVPPLRERKDDVPLLARRLLAALAPGRPLEPTEAAWALLLAHDWPGNVRELRNVLERAALLSQHGTIEAAALGLF
jgi:pSer/pThr/pTyr-binding forkhead associated (FHA) protein